jgi:hypothetical protein
MTLPPGKFSALPLVAAHVVRTDITLRTEALALLILLIFKYYCPLNPFRVVVCSK